MDCFTFLNPALSALVRRMKTSTLIDDDMLYKPINAKTGFSSFRGSRLYRHFAACRCQSLSRCCIAAFRRACHLRRQWTHPSHPSHSLLFQRLYSPHLAMGLPILLVLSIRLFLCRRSVKLKPCRSNRARKSSSGQLLPHLPDRDEHHNEFVCIAVQPGNGRNSRLSLFSSQLAATLQPLLPRAMQARSSAALHACHDSRLSRQPLWTTSAPDDQRRSFLSLERHERLCRGPSLPEFTRVGPVNFVFFSPLFQT
jgi:hypothetical protein